MRGRRTEPATLKILKGRGDGLDSGGRAVVRLSLNRMAPAKPRGLPRAASEHWDRIVPELDRAGALSPAHVGGLTALVCTWARIVEAQKLLEQEGILAFNSQGRVRHPAVAVLEAAQREYRQWCAEFGLTPASESKAGRLPTPAEDDNPFA